MADQEQVRNETQQVPKDNVVAEPMLILGWDHRGHLCMNPASEKMPTLVEVVGMLRRMADVMERQIVYIKPQEQPQLVLARGKLPRFPESNGRH